MRMELTFEKMNAQMKLNFNEFHILSFPEQKKRPWLAYELRRRSERNLRRGIRGSPQKTKLRLAEQAARSGKLYRAPSRLYRIQILQVNMRLKAIAEIYTMHSFAHLCNLNFLMKNCQHFAKFYKIQKI